MQTLTLINPQCVRFVRSWDNGASWSLGVVRLLVSLQLSVCLFVGNISIFRPVFCFFVRGMSRECFIGDLANSGPSKRTIRLHQVLDSNERPDEYGQSWAFETSVLHELSTPRIPCKHRNLLLLTPLQDGAQSQR